jgi:hypothetical protein
MRLISTTIAIAALLVSGAAVAAEGKEAGKAGASGTQPGGESPGGGKQADLTETRDRPTDTTFSNKTWEVGAGFEYHHTGFNAESLDNGILRNVDYFSLFARWDPTPYDRVSASFGVYQYFLSDAGESGVRADDISVKYTRRIPLPGKVTLRAAFSLSAPVSYGSQLAGVITVPKLSLQADRRFGKYLTLDARVTGGYYIVKYAEGGSSYNGGGNSGFGLGNNQPGAYANPKGTLSMGLTADLAMPFHEPLSVGLSLYNGYAWVYNVCGNGMQPLGSGHEQSFGMPQGMGTCMQDPTVSQGGQPFKQSYGYEIYLHYTLPTLAGLKTDLSFTYAPLGDATLGYTGVQHGTGTDHVYLFWRQAAEFYAGLTARY